MYILDTVGFIHIENNKLLLAASRNKQAYYLPGGKREGSESHIQALMREVYEELNVMLITNSIQYFDTFIEDAYGEGEGIQVSVRCYFARFTGSMRPTSEIRGIKYFTFQEYRDVHEKAPVMQHIFDSLQKHQLL